MHTQRRKADEFAYRLSLWIGAHWLETAGILVAVGVVGGVLAGILTAGGWGAVGTFETGYAVLLAIFIFIWTLAGYSERQAEHRVRGAEEFAAAVQRSTSFGRGPLDGWHRTKLSEVLDVDRDRIEDELLLWLLDQPGVRGPRELLVVTKRLQCLRLVGRGAGGQQVIDLATGSRVDT